MVRTRKSVITSVISFAICIVIALIIFFIRQSKYKGKKCYLDTVIETEDYNLSFYKFFNTTNSRAAVWVEITITNNTTETIDFKLSNVAIKDDNGTAHKTDGYTLTIAPGAEDYYQYGYYCDNNNDTNKYILCFKINGKAYNVYFRNE